MKLLSTVTLLVVLSVLLPNGALAAECSATYVDGITNSHASGSIKFQNEGRLLNNPDTVLASKNVFNNGWVNTCTSADCMASGTTVPSLTATFQSHSTSSDATVNGYNALLTGNNYDVITVKNSARLSTSSSHSTFTFRKVIVQNWSTLSLVPGDYYIDDLEFKNGSRLEVNGSGTVRIYSRQKMRFRQDSIINGGSSGDASKLFLYYFAQGDQQIKVESGAKVAAFLYSQNKVDIKNTSDVYGGVAAEGEVKLRNSGWVTYRSNAVANVDFGSACSSGPATVHHYEISHDGSGSTCAAEPVTIKACLDASCNSLSTDSISLEFHAGGVSKGSHTFTGSTSFNFNHTAEQTLALSVSGASVAATNALVCKQGSSSSCDITFTSSGCQSGNTCAATFGDAASNSTSSGEVKFEYYGRLISNPDTVLASSKVVHNGSYIKTCATADCTVSGSPVPALVSSYSGYSSSSNLTVSGQSRTIGGNNYQDVVVKDGAILNMSSGYNSYHFKKLTVENLSVVNMTPGDYYIEELEVKVASFINVIGSGTVRLHVKNKAIFQSLSLINGGLFGDAAKLYIYFFGDGDNVLESRKHGNHCRFHLFGPRCGADWLRRGLWGCDCCGTDFD